MRRKPTVNNDVIMEKQTCFQKLQSIQKILDSELTHVEKLVLIKMAMYDDCYITNKWLSVTLGTSVETIKRAIAGLKSKKIIAVKRTVKANTKIQRRQVTDINLEHLNINTRKTGIKTQGVMDDPLKKENSLELQSVMSDPLKPNKTTDEQAQPSQQRAFQLQSVMSDPLKPSGQDLENGTTKPTTDNTSTIPLYIDNKYISNKKTISIYSHTNTKFSKRSDFSMNKSTNTTENKRFKKPTVEEIRQYCTERGNTLDPEYFYDYYESVGWVVGKNRPMKDWKAAIRTWERNEKKRNIVRLPTGQAQQKYTQSWYDKDAELRKQAVMAVTGDNHDK